MTSTPQQSSQLWYEITAEVPPEQVEAVAAVMREVAPGGVSVEEPIRILGPEEGYIVLPGKPVLVKIYLPASELGAVLTDDLRHRMLDFPDVELVAKPLYEQDWAVSWRAFFGVVETGGKVIVVPSWIEHDAKPGQMVIKLDPGQAFGTGHHETTRMCMLALEGAVKPGMSVLDVGTGSGILAITAVLLGAGRVRAIDIDPIATRVALENFAENGVTGQIEVSTGVLDESVGAGFDIVVANINRDANTSLAGAFARAAAPGGTLILSGILDDDAERVTKAAEDAGFSLRATNAERDWRQLTLVRLPATT